MKHEGRGVIRLGDSTDHGGHVISASSGTVVMGTVAALADDMTFCPVCKGQFAIKPDGTGARHAGRHYAYHGDVTMCGAHLISSLAAGSAGVPATEKAVSEFVDANARPASGFDDRFVLLSEETGKPAAFTEYALARENGSIEYGVTNGKGETHLMSATAAAEEITVYVDVGG